MGVFSATVAPLREPLSPGEVKDWLCSWDAHSPDRSPPSRPRRAREAASTPPRSASGPPVPTGPSRSCRGCRSPRGGPPTGARRRSTGLMTPSLRRAGQTCHPYLSAGDLIPQYSPPDPQVGLSTLCRPVWEAPCPRHAPCLPAAVVGGLCARGSDGHCRVLTADFPLEAAPLAGLVGQGASVVP